MLLSHDSGAHISRDQYAKREERKQTSRRCKRRPPEGKAAIHTSETHIAKDFGIQSIIGSL